MKNKLPDLRNHLFAQLERLTNEDITAEELEKEVFRADAVVNVSKQIVETAKVEVTFIKAIGGKDTTGFILPETAQELTEKKKTGKDVGLTALK
jgi:hypothetical protein